MQLIRARLAHGICRYDSCFSTKHWQKCVKAALRGFSTATDLADYLVKMAWHSANAHEIVGKAVALGVQEGKDLSELSLEQLQQFSDLIQADVFEKSTDS